MPTKTFLIAASKLWNPEIARELSAQTGHNFLLITKKEELTLETLKQLSPEKVFFPHWSYIIPKDIHSQYECIIFHMTDLPYGRGGSPLQNLIIRGHKETKMSALRCVTDLDAGPIYLKKDLSLNGNANDIYRRATTIIQEMISEIIKDAPVPKEQIGEPVIFHRRTPAQSDISLCQNQQEIYDIIRMLDADGYPNAYLQLPNGLKIDFSNAVLNGTELTARVRISK
ncbi:Methionyl-tRNA formyltransferase [compost metagenome]